MIVDVRCYIHLRWSCCYCLGLDPLLKKQFWHVLSVCLPNFPLYVRWIVLGQVNLRIYKTSIWFMWYLHSKLSGNDFFTTTTQKRKELSWQSEEFLELPDYGGDPLTDASVRAPDHLLRLDLISLCQDDQAAPLRTHLLKNGGHKFCIKEQHSTNLQGQMAFFTYFVKYIHFLGVWVNWI